MTEMIQGRVHDFDCPLYTQLEGNLWWGGCPEAVAPEEVTTIVSLYPWGRYKVHSHQNHFVHTMYDAEYVPDSRLLFYLADLVVAAAKEGVTLVHCQKGINRSSLIAALALIRSGGDPYTVIARMRSIRSPQVLYNKSFYDWLLTQ